MNIVVISGGFDPIHSGHLDYISSAKKNGDKLVVLLNSDLWLRNKKGKEFLPFDERKAILEAMENVDEVYDFEDDDIGSCILGLKKIKTIYSKDKIIFCNGGDRTEENIPEMTLHGIEFKFEIGGNNKKNSSSWILKNWQYPFEERVWGSFFNLYESYGVKVKELIVNPNSGMSFQRHFKRNEIWLVSEGKCIVNKSDTIPEEKISIELKMHDQLFVPVESWHQITNPFDEICKIIEIQFGEETVEDDIERLSLYGEESQ